MAVKKDFLFDLTGIGNACMDIVADCSFDFLNRHNVRKSHCVYVDLPDLEKLKAELVRPEWVAGGAAANTIYTFQNLGGRTAFLGKIADDPEGRAFEKSMTDIGIETRLQVETAGNIGSTQVICLRTPDGDRSFVTYQGVAETIRPNDIDFDIVAKSHIVYFDGYTMYSPHALDIFMNAADTVRRKRGLSVFNPGDLSIATLYTDKIGTLIKNIDMVICNLAEANAIFGTETLQNAAQKIPDIHRLGVVTNGAEGAMAFKDGEIILMPPSPSFNQDIYTLGAGDHFSAGFLYGLTRDYPLKEMVRLAELCALDCLTHASARPLSSLKHLIDRMDQI